MNPRPHRLDKTRKRLVRNRLKLSQQSRIPSRETLHAHRRRATVRPLTPINLASQSEQKLRPRIITLRRRQTRDEPVRSPLLITARRRTLRRDTTLNLHTPRQLTPRTLRVLAPLRQPSPHRRDRPANCYRGLIDSAATRDRRNDHIMIGIQSSLLTSRSRGPHRRVNPPRSRDQLHQRTRDQVYAFKMRKTLTAGSAAHLDPVRKPPPGGLWRCLRPCERRTGTDTAIRHSRGLDCPVLGVGPFHVTVSGTLGAGEGDLTRWQPRSWKKGPYGQLIV